jgi:small-conductance mechanosensitive channel
MQPAISDLATVTSLRQTTPASEQFLNASDKVTAFPAISAQQEAARSVAVPAPASQQRDWPSALALIEETSEAIRISDLRYAQLEERLQQTISQAAVNMRELEAQIATSNEMLWRSEERARQAEARAVEAEAWLARLHDAVTTSFSQANRSQSRG